MKYFSLALIIICAMVINLIADLNFADGTHDAHGWDTICGSLIFFGGLALIVTIVVDTLRDYDASQKDSR